MIDFTRITSNPNRMDGEPLYPRPTFDRSALVEAVALYPDRDELKAEYPELDDEDIQQALAYAPRAWMIGFFPCRSHHDREDAVGPRFASLDCRASP